VYFCVGVSQCLPNLAISLRFAADRSFRGGKLSLKRGDLIQQRFSGTFLTDNDPCLQTASIPAAQIGAVDGCGSDVLSRSFLLLRWKDAGANLSLCSVRHAFL